MRRSGARTFWLSLGVTLIVLLPLIAAVGFLGRWRDLHTVPAEHSRSDIPIHMPGGEHEFNLLTVLTGEEPVFVLLRLDAPGSRVSITALPAQTVLPQQQGSVLLGECYQDAGPARAAALLEETLQIKIRYYTAITPDKLAEALGPVTARVNLTGLLNEKQRQAAGLGSPVQEFTPAAAMDFLRGQPLEPHRLAALRCAVWEAFVRQDLDLLPSVLPDGLRRVSSTLLTNLTAMDLYTLGDTLEFLADRGGRAESSPVPGRWNPSGRFELQPDTLSWAARLFGGTGKAAAPAEPTPTELPEPAPALPAPAGGLS